MLEADTAAIEAYLGEFPYAGSSRIQDKEALKAAGASWNPDQRMWVAKSHEALLRMIETRRWRPNAAVHPDLIAAYLKERAAEKAAAEAAAQAAKMARVEQITKKKKKKSHGDADMMRAIFGSPGGKAPAAPEPAPEPPTGPGGPARRKRSYDDDEEDEEAMAMRWLPRRPEDLPPDERAIYERSKTMPPIAAPPTVCPVCRILIHDQFLDCHCTYRDGVRWARCALPGCAYKVQCVDGAPGVCPQCTKDLAS